MGTKKQKIPVSLILCNLQYALCETRRPVYAGIFCFAFPDPLSEDARTIRIDKDFAKILYTKWRKTVQVFLFLLLNLIMS